MKASPPMRFVVAIAVLLCVAYYAVATSVFKVMTGFSLITVTTYAEPWRTVAAGVTTGALGLFLSWRPSPMHRGRRALIMLLAAGGGGTVLILFALTSAIVCDVLAGSVFETFGPFVYRRIAFDSPGPDACLTTVERQGHALIVDGFGLVLPLPLPVVGSAEEVIEALQCPAATR